MKKILIITAVLVLCIAFAGCGSSGYGQGEQFPFGDDTYSLEKVVRAPDKDTASTDRYGVSLLQVGDTAPVIITGIGAGSMSTKSKIDVVLNGDPEIATTSVFFEPVKDVEGYGCRIIFYFDLPKGAAMPDSAVVKDNAGGDETVDLDLTGLEPVEETTEATTAPTTDLSDLPVDPNYDPEANKGVGDPSPYQPIESFDIETPDIDQ